MVFDDIAIPPPTIFDTQRRRRIAISDFASRWNDVNFSSGVKAAKGKAEGRWVSRPIGNAEAQRTQRNAEIERAKRMERYLQHFPISLCSLRLCVSISYSVA